MSKRPKRPKRDAGEQPTRDAGERPTRDAVANREATDTLLSMQRRRTSAQVQRDKELTARAKAAAKAQKTAIAGQKKKAVADFEDQLRREDQQREKNMARPDLAAQAAPSQRVCVLLQPHVIHC
jgi:hypothetical protein